MAGFNVVYLKRIVALEGDTVAFSRGILLVNGRSVAEPYVVRKGDWELPPRTVGPGKVYVVGDNRSMSMESHVFGQTRRSRLMGGPLW